MADVLVSSASGSDLSRWVSQLLQCKPLAEKDVMALCSIVEDFLRAEPVLVRVDPPVCIVGDLHGQFHDLLELFKTAGGPPPKNAFLFIGDFVDRGFNSVETLQLLLALKVREEGPRGLVETREKGTH